MFKALLRLVSMILLSIAVIMAVLDATRSIAAETIVLTPLGVSWSAVAPVMLSQLRDVVTGSLPNFFWDPLFTGVLALPGFAVFTVLALLMAMLGRRRERPEMRFRPAR